MQSHEKSPPEKPKSLSRRLFVCNKVLLEPMQVITSIAILALMLFGAGVAR